MQPILNNLSWLAIGRIFQLLASATVGVLVARYLGPSDFGRMSFSIAFVSLFIVVVPLGMPSVLIREMVRDRTSQVRLLGIAVATQSVAAIMVYGIVVSAIGVVAHSDRMLLTLAAIYGLTVLAKPADVFRTWFEAEVKSGYVVRMEMAVLVVASLAKILAIVLGSSVWVFVAIQAALMSANSFGAMLVYRRVTRRQLFSEWDTGTALNLLSQSWPMIISAVGLVLYLQIDQVMLGRMASDTQVGLYSAALRLSEVWYSVPMLLVSTLFPAIVRAHEASAERFRARIAALLELFNGVSICIALVISISSGWIVKLLYGEAYADAGPVLALHVWSAVFIFMGTITGKWYLLQGIQRWNIFRNFLGAGVNIVLNLWAIPLWGAWGAALTTLLSYMAANFLADIFTASARPLFFEKLRALFLWPRLFWRPKSRLAKL